MVSVADGQHPFRPAHQGESPPQLQIFLDSRELQPGAQPTASDQQFYQVQIKKGHDSKKNHGLFLWTEICHFVNSNDLRKFVTLSTCQL